MVPLALEWLNRKQDPMRAGALCLPMAAHALRRDILRKMLEVRVTAGPGRHYAVSEAGVEGLFVAHVAELWLQSAPGGPLPLEGDDEEGAVNTLLEGWRPGIVHALARGPRTLEELERVVDLRRRALCERVAAMRELGMLEPLPGAGEGERYAVSEWLRRAIAPLLAAIRAELRDPNPEAAPIEASDVEAAFLLALPLLELPAGASGCCRLTVEGLEGSEAPAATVIARVDAGRVAARVGDQPGDQASAPASDKASDPPAGAGAWATAAPAAWLDTVIERDVKSVATGGDRLLARLLLDGLHEALFGVPVRD